MNKRQKHALFIGWWGSVPQKEVAEKRKEIIEKCFISPFIFRHWEKGNTEIPTFVLAKIEEIAGEKIFKLEESEVINEH